MKMKHNLMKFFNKIPLFVILKPAFGTKIKVLECINFSVYETSIVN